MIFAAVFRHHVTPVLREAARKQGALLALERTSFEEAYDAIFEIAMKRGACYLSDPLFEELRDWISAELLRQMYEFLPDVIAYREMAERVFADIARCEAVWARTMTA